MFNLFSPEDLDSMNEPARLNVDPASHSSFYTDWLLGNAFVQGHNALLEGHPDAFIYHLSELLWSCFQGHDWV